MEVRATDAAATHVLRRAILRPHQTIEEMDWPGDDHPEAIHLVAHDDDDAIGMVSFYPLERPGSDATKSFRLRGMGVVPARRNEGIGYTLVDEGLERVRAVGGDEIWCHARVGAVPFYEQVGFATEGGYWDVPVIGPHIVMHRRV